MSCFTSPHTPIILPVTHHSSCIGSFVKQISKYSLIGTEIWYLKPPLPAMNESSDSDTEIDELSLVNVVVVDANDNLVAAIPNNVSRDIQQDATPGVALIIDPPSNNTDLYQTIRVADAMWKARIQDDGCQMLEIRTSKKDIHAIDNPADWTK